MTTPSNSPLSEDNRPVSIVQTPQMRDAGQIRNRSVGVIALLFSVLAPILVGLAYLLQSDTGFYLGFHGVLYGPITSGVATLLSIFALPDRYARIALCISGLWWAWWIYAITQWRWDI